MRDFVAYCRPSSLNGMQQLKIRGSCSTYGPLPVVLSWLRACEMTLIVSPSGITNLHNTQAMYTSLLLGVKTPHACLQQNLREELQERSPFLCNRAPVCSVQW